MRALVAGIDAVTGLLLVAIPRFAFPPCGWDGRAGMHCTRTAWAELALGGALVVVAVLTTLVRRPRLLLAEAGASLGLAGLAVAAPSVYGVCASPQMPCHYGMAPSARFVAGLAFVILLGAILRLARGSRAEEEPA